MVDVRRREGQSEGKGNSGEGRRKEKGGMKGGERKRRKIGTDMYFRLTPHLMRETWKFFQVPHLKL
jgi:hypothetical protein